MFETPNRLLAGLFAAMLVVTLVPAGVAAQEAPAPDPDDADLDRLVELYNENVEKVPGFVRGQVSDERVELRYGEGDTVAKKDTGTALHFETDDRGRITDYGEGDAEKPTVRVRTSESAYRAIVTAEDPVAAFMTQYREGNVKINGVSVTKSVTVEAVKAAAWAGQKLGLF
jgi:hypothetical protein